MSVFPPTRNLNTSLRSHAFQQEHDPSETDLSRVGSGSSNSNVEGSIAKVWPRKLPEEAKGKRGRRSQLRNEGASRTTSTRLGNTEGSPSHNSISYIPRTTRSWGQRWFSLSFLRTVPHPANAVAVDVVVVVFGGPWMGLQDKTDAAFNPITPKEALGGVDADTGREVGSQGSLPQIVRAGRFGVRCSRSATGTLV